MTSSESGSPPVDTRERRSAAPRTREETPAYILATRFKLDNRPQDEANRAAVKDRIDKKLLEIARAPAPERTDRKKNLEDEILRKLQTDKVPEYAADLFEEIITKELWEDPETALIHAGKVHEAVVETLYAVENNIIEVKNADAKAFLSKLSNTPDLSPLDSEAAVYLYDILNNILLDPNYFKINKIDEPPSEFQRDIERISMNEEVLRRVREALLAAKRDGALADITETEIETRFTSYYLKNETSKYAFERYDEELQKEIHKDGSNPHALRVLQAIDDPRKFPDFFRAEAKIFLGGREWNDPTVSDAEREKAGMLVTENMHKDIQYLVGLIFADVLDSPASERFAQIAQTVGGQYKNPNLMYQQTIERRLRRLSREARKMRRDPKSERGIEGLIFGGYGQKQRDIYNPERNKYETVVESAKHIKPTSYAEFTTTLLEIAQTEKGFYEYGHDFKFATEHSSAVKESFFKTIAGFAGEALDSSTLDRIYAMPYSEVIYAARITIENMYKRMFAAEDWRKMPSISTDPTDVFDSFNNAENAALKHLLSTYQGRTGKDHIPAWAVRRAFYHARTEFFGKEFMFQLMASYADPAVTDDGERTFLSEGYLANQNAAFDVTELVKRWLGDPEMGGGVYIPVDRVFKNFDPLRLAELGKELFAKTYKHGRLAYMGYNDFEDSHLLMDYNNMSGMGGVDMQAGWRLKYAYAPYWLKGKAADGTDIMYFDQGSHQLDLSKGGDTMLVDCWRSVDKIGINVVRDFSSNLVFGDSYGFLKIDSKKPNEFKNGPGKKYEELFKFLYKRYLNNPDNPDSIGKVFITKNSGGQMSETEYMAYIKDILYDKSKDHSERGAALRDEIWKIQTVMLHERNPLQFLLSEKQRTTFGQVLYKEIMKHFNVKSTEVKDPWNKNEFNDALSDLDLVEQQARLDSIDVMRASEQAEGHLRGLPGAEEYMINSHKVRTTLEKHYAVELSRKAEYQAAYDSAAPGSAEKAVLLEKINNIPRVERALSLYQEITKRLAQKPEDTDLELQWKNSNEKAETRKQYGHLASGETKKQLYERAQQKKKVRAIGFMETWKSGQFGMAFNSDTAQGYLVRSATGQETIARAAGAVATTAESMKSVFSGFNGEGTLMGEMKSESRSAEDKMDGIASVITDVRVKIKDEDGDMANKFAGLLDRVVSNIMMRADYAQGMSGKLASELMHTHTSIISKVTKEGEVYDWDKEEKFKFTHRLLRKGCFSRYTADKDKVYKEVEIKDLPLPQRLKHKLAWWASGKAGDPPKVMVRDYGSELSGDSIRRSYKAGKWDIVKSNNIPQAVFLFMLVMFLLGKEGFKEMSFD